jgi:hypothetical protein
MPHDVRGNVLKVGDTVVLVLKVTDLASSEDFCNAVLESVHGRRPDGEKETLCSINTGVLERIPEGMVVGFVDINEELKHHVAEAVILASKKPTKNVQERLAALEHDLGRLLEPTPGGMVNSAALAGLVTEVGELRNMIAAQSGKARQLLAEHNSRLAALEDRTRHLGPPVVQDAPTPVDGTRIGGDVELDPLRASALDRLVDGA